MADSKSQTALLKFGRVDAVTDAGTVCVRFDDLDGMVSDPLKVVVPRASKDKAHHPPDMGALVACVVDESLEDGVVLGEVYNASQTPATNNADLWFWRMVDGSEFEFDRSSGKLRIKTTSDIAIDSGATVSIKAATAITLDAPVVKVTQDLDIGGGISQGSGAGGKALFKGLVETLGDFLVAGKSLLHHKHRENGPGSMTDDPS